MGNIHIFSVLLFSQSVRPSVRKNLDPAITNKVLEPGDSEYTSPCFFVTKKPGEGKTSSPIGPTILIPSYSMGIKVGKVCNLSGCQISILLQQLEFHFFILEVRTSNFLKLLEALYEL